MQSAKTIRLRPIRYGEIFDGVRVLGRLMAPSDMTWTTETMAGDPARPFILHLSCLAHYTPHIPYIAQKVLAKIGIDCPIYGGPENCCGALHMHLGDERLAAITARMGLMGFRRAKPTTVLSVCPDCDESFAANAPAGQRFFHHANVSELFVEHLERLKPLMRPLNRRLVIHTHASNPARVKDAENITTLLAGIPGVELVGSEHRQGLNSHCQILQPMPVPMRDAMFEDAVRLGADTIVMPYHSCYRQHITGEMQHPVKVQHYLSVLAAALDIEVPETYKELRFLNDVDRAVDALRPRFEPLGLDERQIRDVVASSIYI